MIEVFLEVKLKFLKFFYVDDGSVICESKSKNLIDEANEFLAENI